MKTLRSVWKGTFKKESSSSMRAMPTTARLNYTGNTDPHATSPIQRKRSSSMGDIFQLGKDINEPMSRKRLSRKLSAAPDKRASISFGGLEATIKNYTSLAIEVGREHTEESDYTASEVEEVISENTVLTVTEKLHATCIRGKLPEMIQLLEQYEKDNEGVHLDFNTDFLDNTSNACTLMHRAAKYQRVDIMNYLYDRGASVEVKDVLDATPLFYAVSTGSLRASSFLLSKHAAVNIRDKFECSPAWAALRNNHLEVVRLLLLFNADVHYKVRQGQTLLHLACEEGVEEKVTFLLQNGANPLRTNRAGENCLFSALAHPAIARQICEKLEHQDIMKMLRTPNTSGYTVFHQCAHYGYLLSLMWIIQYVPLPYQKQLKEMINDQEKTINQNTPLHLAIIHGHRDIVSYLVQRCGKDIEFERQNALGDTVLHTAIRELNAPIFALLKRSTDGKYNKIKNQAKLTPKKLASTFGERGKCVYEHKEDLRDVSAGNRNNSLYKLIKM